MSLHGEDDRSRYQCITHTTVYRYTQKRISIEYTKKYEWETFAIGNIHERLDTAGITNAFDKVEEIVELTGVLKSFDHGDAATYITIECDGGEVLEFSRGYAHPQNVSGEDLIGNRIKLFARKVQVNYFERCKILTK
jgi:hypothetical protein